MDTVANSEPVVAHFGYWPTYADGTVLRFAIDGSTIELTIRYGDSMTRRSGEVDLRFEGVSNAELTELRERNYLDAVSIEAGSPMQVQIEAAYGLCGSFACNLAAVVAFRASSLAP